MFVCDASVKENKSRDTATDPAVVEQGVTAVEEFDIMPELLADETSVWSDVNEDEAIAQQQQQQQQQYISSSDDDYFSDTISVISSISSSSSSLDSVSDSDSSLWNVTLPDLDISFD